VLQNENQDSLLRIGFSRVALLFTTSATATENETGSSTAELSTDEIVYMEASLQGLELGQATLVDILYNHEGTPKFCLGIAEGGYLIVDRDTLAILEKAEGSSIYADYADAVKYFGGIGLYFIQTEDGYLDLLSNETTEQIPYIEAIDNMGIFSADTPEDGEGRLSPLSLNAFATANDLPYTSSIAQKISFGNNGGATPNSCTAVATGLILNYLDRTVDGNIVPY
jgi:hypothetical protein